MKTPRSWARDHHDGAVVVHELARLYVERSELGPSRISACYLDSSNFCASSENFEFLFYVE